MLVCCTGGEEGDILNPAVDTPEVRENLHEVRMEELQASVDAIGYEQLYMLGYRDSGMKDTESNAHPDNFANAPFDEAVERLVRIIRAERPQVIITYGDDSKFYPHPDHVRVHEISGPAFDAAGDPDRFPDAGDPWQPSKLYYTGWSARRVRALHEAFLARGEESPYASWFEERGFDETLDQRLHDVRRRRRLPGQPARGAARAPDAGGPDRVLDAPPRRRRPRGLPVGGVRAGPHASSTPACPRASPRTICSPGCASAPAASGRVEETMTQYLSQDWLDQARGARGRPAGAPGRDGADPVARRRGTRR